MKDKKEECFRKRFTGAHIWQKRLLLQKVNKFRLQERQEGKKELKLEEGERDTGKATSIENN